MKKLIVAAAGLMLAGTMVSTASAEPGVSFTGDGRARAFYFQDYNFVDSDTSNWNSRVRLKIKAESKGGAYAVARLRMSEAKWDGTKLTRDGGEQSNLFTDYAYVGTPIGPVSIEGGLMPFNVTTFALWDIRVDGANIKYSNDSTTVVAFYHKLDEFDESQILTVTNVATGTTTIIDNDLINDDDIDQYGILVDQKFDGGWGLVASVWAKNDDQATGNDGFAVAAEVTGAMGNVGLLGDIAWFDGDYFGYEDDPFGVYGQVAAPIGAVTLAAGLGYTMDGFQADGDFGPFIMLSDVSNIATGVRIGSLGDTLFGALVPSFKVSEELTLTGVVAYADIDNDLLDSVDSAFEVSGSAVYAVTDGAELSFEAGYLDVDGLPEPAVGAGVILDVSF
ncbi:MAG: porin [Desulfobulbaceae bacterium]|nr:MAG: porin [Desulfobulbaceae bacterium]